jgi:alanine racemase
VLRPRRAAPADIVRPTRAEVFLDALRHNLRVVQRHAAGAKVWGVLKADGYGHGAPAVARTLERSGIDGFCVALLEEGIELREAGIAAPVLVMGGYYGNAHAEVIARRLTPVVYEIGQVEAFARLVRAGDAPEPIDVHLKVDTGMSRLGVMPDELSKFIERLRDFPEVRVTGLMTHLAQADAAEAEPTDMQIARFEEASSLASKLGLNPEVRHAANTAALLRARARFDLVRPGIALFGVAPPVVGGHEPLSMELRPAMRVRSEIVSIRDVAPGTGIGYGALFSAKRKSRVATIPMGYADGLSRQLSNRGFVLVRGKRAPIVGAVSMDMAMIDVTDVPGVTLRDEVVVLGPQDGPFGRDVITATEVAGQSDTIAWEVLTAISRRVPRFYREP